MCPRRPESPLPPPSPFHPSGLSQYTDFECPALCIKLGLVIYLTCVFEDTYYCLSF